MNPTPQQIEKARKVANDINEGIDCGETRKELREIIAAFADLELQAFEKGRGKSLRKAHRFLKDL